MIWTIFFSVSELAAVNLGLIQEGFMGGDFKKIATAAKVLYLHEEMSTNSTISNILLKDPQTGTSILGVLVASIHFIGILPHYVCISTLDKNVLVLALLGRHLVMDFIKFSKEHEANMIEVIPKRNTADGYRKSYSLVYMNLFIIGISPVSSSERRRSGNQ